MNREDVIKLAREAGLTDESFERDWYVFQLERFAALVAAAERKKVRASMKKAHVRINAYLVAAERESWPAEMEAMERQVNILTDALAQAKAEEREACAKVCGDLHLEGEDNTGLAADLIRARSQS